MNRRNAFKAVLAALAWPFVPRVAEAKAEEFTLNIPVVVDRGFLRKQIMAARDPDYIPEPEGVLGETYFKVGAVPRFPSPKRLYLNGVDVTHHCNESDCVGGWVRMFDVDANGKHIVPLRVRTHYGKVEIR